VSQVVAGPRNAFPIENRVHIQPSVVDQEQFPMSDQQSASTTDTTYNLISVIYHSLQAVDTFHTYQRDAEETGDSELSALLQNAMQQQQDLAAKAKKLLAQRLAQTSDS
jgi:hypothetical protein